MDRWRHRLKWLLFLLLLLPGLVASVLWYEGHMFLRSGMPSSKIEEAIDARWSPFGLPKGLVHVGSVEVLSYNTVRIHDLVLGEAGERPLATAESAEAKLYIMDPGLSDLVLDGLDVRLDQASYDLLNRIIHAEHERKSTGEHQVTRVTVVNATVRTASGAFFDQVQAFSKSFGPEANVTVQARYAGRLIQIAAKTTRQADQTLALSLDFQRFTGPLAPLIDGTVCIGELAPPPMFLRDYLPAVVDATGTRVKRNLVSDAWDGDLKLSWALDAPGLPAPGLRVANDGTAAPWPTVARGGSVLGSAVTGGATAADAAGGATVAHAGDAGTAAPGVGTAPGAADAGTVPGAGDAPTPATDGDGSAAPAPAAVPGAPPTRCVLKAHLAADPSRIQLTQVHLVDPSVVDGDGTFDADLDHDDIHVAFTTWHPGPRLHIPDVVPVAAILAVLPQIDFHGHVAAPVKLAARLSATGTARSLGDISWEPGKAIAISGSDLPLTLAQTFLPTGVTVVGGEGATMAMTVEDTMREVTIAAEQARMAYKGWTLGPVNAYLKVVPGAVSGVAIDAVLPMGTVSWTGPVEAGHVAITVHRLDDLLAFVHGPYELPDLSGAADLVLDIDMDPNAFAGTVRRLRLENLNHRGSQHQDSLRDLTTTVRGRFAWKDDRLVADFGGQIESGNYLLPVAWLPLAARTPLYTCTFSVTPPRGFAPAGIDVDEILVRAATKAGDPVPGGYSAQLSGSLTVGGTGELTGVVDHADLAWVNGLLPLDPGSMAGQGAIDITADLVSGDVQRVAGSFLPLNADLHLGTGFNATGITGAVHFEMARP